MLAHNHITDEPLSAYTAALHHLSPASRAITAGGYGLAMVNYRQCPTAISNYFQSRQLGPKLAYEHL